MNLSRKAIGPNGPITSPGESVSLFLRKHLTTCDFQGGGGVPDPLSPSLDLTMSVFWK